ncbi:MAG: beta-ketoacyl-[acyl-carrier-protein] synthase family protein [Deltaproteobacteria bacterium]|nr:beta-ketoacyl-[acyl-carrier-protein] synthase family protein [Deltaproteobacteria bacterium]
MKRAAVTGLGCITGAGENLSSMMKSIYAGRRYPCAPTRFETDLKASHPLFEVKKEFPLADEGEDSRTNAFILTALEEALSHAQIDWHKLDRKRIGIVIGTTVGCAFNNDSFYGDYRKGTFPDISSVERYLAGNSALYIAKKFGIRGPAITIANACSSGTDAIGIAKGWIESGRCDLVVAGGADEICRHLYLGFYSLLNTSAEPCRPFDRKRKGLNLGEGAGIMILEECGAAKARGAKAHALVAAYACRSDAYHPTAPHPEGKGLANAVKAVFKASGLRPEEVNFINAHGTSTVENDRIEGTVISRFFPEGIPVVSTKAYTGHTLGGAGGVEAVMTVRGLMDGLLPATAGFEEPDESCGIVPTTKLTEVKGRAAFSNSLAFGGHNAVLAFVRGE